MPFEFRIDMKTEQRGPLFDGRAQAAVINYALHITRVLGEEAVNRIQAYLPTQYMYLGNNGGTPRFNPVPPDAGALAESVHSERVTDDMVLVKDDMAVYGPWIEGIADGNSIVWQHKRNPPPRRFPGYHTFRLISQQLDLEATDIATRELPPYIEEMNV